MKSPNCASHADERVAIGDRVAVLESERGELREHRVVDHERRLRVGDVRERRVLGLGLVVDDGCVPLAERAAARVLTRDADGRAFLQERAEREALGECPVDAIVVELGPAVLQDALELRMRREPVREGHERVDDAVEAFARHAGVDATAARGRLRARTRRPVPVPAPASRRTRLRGASGSLRARARTARASGHRGSRASRCRACGPSDAGRSLRTCAAA